MLARVGASLRKAASLFNGMPDELPAVRSIARFDGAPGGAYAATVHTDREWGGRSRATFRVGHPGASGSPVCAVFEGFIDKRPSDVGVAGGDDGETGRFGFAMLNLRRVDGDVEDCEDYESLVLRANSDGRLYASRPVSPTAARRARRPPTARRLSLRNSVPLAPNLAYQGFLTDDGARGWRDFELPFTSFAATRGGRNLDQPRILDIARFGSLSIAVADDLEGPFRIELAAIDATREPGQL